jgi:hypothetical protein
MDRSVLAVDPLAIAVEDAILAHVGLVGPRRSVDGNERHLVALAEVLGGERVVAKTAPSVPVGGARGDGKDLHDQRVIFSARASGGILIRGWALQ